MTGRSPWMGIELRHMLALEAVAREGSFRLAAEALGYAQSAISQQLAHLERIVGARLVERRRGVAPVALTEAGELLLRHFGEILAHLVAAQADLEALTAGRTGRLRVGVDASVASRLMPAILPTLSARLPGVQVEMEESRSGAELAELISAGGLDLAFADMPLPPGPFEWRELVRDPYVLLVPVGWELASASAPPELDGLTGVPLIEAGRNGQAELVRAAFDARGARPRYVLRSENGTATQALVAAGVGAAIMPRLAVNSSDDRTSLLPLDGTIPPRVLALYWHSERISPPALDEFVDIAATVAAGTGEDPAVTSVVS